MLNEGGFPYDSDEAVEFRSPTDDAWHPVLLDLVVNLLFVTYVEVYATKKQDVFGPHNFDTLGQVEDFRMRFRPSSEPVRDEDCYDVEVRMTVCVIKDFGGGDWRLYDGVVNAVKRGEHEAAGTEDEECRCIFLIFWKHGPLGGTVTSERLNDILFLVPDTGETHQALMSFMDKTRQRFQTSGKPVQSPTSRVVPSGDRDGPTLSEVQPSLARRRDSLLCNWKMPSNELPQTREMEKPLRMPGIERKPTMSSCLPPMVSSVEGIGSNNGMNIEFRSFRDDAWHGVNLSMTLAGKLVINYDDYTMFGVEESHEPDEFNTLGEIEDFRERFRPLSSHLSPGECHEVKVGDLVCVRYGFEGTEESRFYDAIVKEVVRYQHAVLDGTETCFCSFEIFWKHGPSGGTISTTDIHHICMTVPVPENEIHPVLASFLDIARRELGPPEKRSRIDEQNPNLPPGFCAADGQGNVTLSRGEPSTRGKGKKIVINDS